MTAPDKNIKEAPSDIIQFDEDSIDIALLQDLLYEDIAATELANISRTDLVDGQSVIYSPIKNLSSVRQEFNPNNVIATSIATNYFSRFGIDIDVRGINEPYVDDNGNLVIEIDTVGEGEEIQVQILLNGTINVVDES
jgi:predicted nicotinamide N-methyase